MKWVPCIALSGLIMACNSILPEKQDLTSTTQHPSPGPDCSSCHGYPLDDTNHVYHLFYLDSNIANNRPVTCLHCHNTALQSRDTTFLDSIFVDTNGIEYRALDYPHDIELRTFALRRIDSLIQNRPIAMPPRPGLRPKIQEWVTAMAHMNGTVDVVFDKTSIDTARFHGMNAAYNPKLETCSAIACHPNPGEYRWPAPSRGWRILTGDTNHVAK